MPPKTSAKRKPSQPPPEPPRPPSLEERTAKLEMRLRAAPAELHQKYRENLDVSWILHDSALEGTVFSFQELRAAMAPGPALTADTTLQPACEEIRRHRDALNFIRDYASKVKLPITIDVVKKIYVTLHPEEGDVKTVKYRKDVPQHRLYFHEYAQPDKIPHKMRQIIDWIVSPETHRTRSPVRIATRAHYDIVRVFPFPQDSGKVARLFMNLLLLRTGYPPVIIHSAERQRYYEALKGASATMNTIVAEAIENSLLSIEKLLDAYDNPVPPGFR